MAEEFQESEVIFEEYQVDEEDSISEVDSNHINNRRAAAKTARKKQIVRKSSVPVNIPENMSRNSWLRCMESDFDGDDGEMVPPHVIIGRRVAGKVMAYSVCTGNGRTLKGRELCQVRNSILRMTGFLET